MMGIRSASARIIRATHAFSLIGYLGKRFYVPTLAKADESNENARKLIV